ncbi:hypothetical protein CWC16_16740 [Pseudoalteromonas sp. S3776]|nr:hypothetical protein CWC17_05295 [Pseudoalteromonas sp. S3785]TMO77912.1 hypothetical protein CWC16_16740 [Pseudoalteromonas sp. S3776]
MISNHFTGLNVSLSALKNSHLEQLNSEFFALLSTRLSIPKIDHLLTRIGMSNSLILNKIKPCK